ncbi:cobalamin B12-binding domain-containing protein [Streptomyces xiamenensis]
MIDPPTSAGGRDAVLLRAREGLWRSVRSRDEHAAAAAVFAALDDGAGAEDVLLEVIAPVQHKVGTEWAADRLTVAQEHAATAIQDRIITAMADRVPVTRPRGGRGTVAVACVDGDWHVLPTRILAEVLRHRGYPVDFLGAQVPTSRLIAHLHRTAPAALALSSSLPTHLPGAHTAISAAQAAGVPVLAGGAAFGADGRYARLLGADGWAPDARGATAVLDGGLPRPHAGAVRQTVEDLPHLADQEYTLVSRSRRQLVRNTMAGLEERVPAMRTYTAAQREHTAEDVLHVVDFLATALYTDDALLFTGFLHWTGDVLRARGVPVRVLVPCLELLQDDLKDLPRARGFLALGLAGALDGPVARNGSPADG